MEEPINQSLIQKKIALAQSEHAPVIIELMKDIMSKIPLVDDKSEWKTIVNTITLDTQSTMLRAMVDYLEDIKKGSLLEPK
jgi:cell fate (sporulation/competence/biofilm development) regulator YmcA (YheA/YmcA/DUF963 family)